MNQDETPEPLSVRASQAPVAMQCPASIYHKMHTPIPDTAAGEPAQYGTIIHGMLSQQISKGRAKPFNPALPEEVRINYFRALRAWNLIEKHFPGRRYVEQQINAGWITAKPDLLAYGKAGSADEAETWLSVLDWKTGRVEREHQDQLIAGAIAFCEANPKAPVDRVWLWQVDVRDPLIQPPAMLTYEQLKEKALTLRENLDLADAMSQEDAGDLRYYTTGVHCEMCRHAKVCPAINQLMRANLDLVAGAEGADLIIAEKLEEAVRNDDREMLQMAWVVKTLAGRLADALQSGFRAVVLNAQGKTVKLPDGARLAITEEEQKVFDTTKTLQVMEDFFGMKPDELYPALKVRWSSLSKLVSDQAPSRGKAQAVKELEETLNKQQAVTYKAIQKLQYKRPTKAISRKANKEIENHGGTQAEDKRLPNREGREDGGLHRN